MWKLDENFSYILCKFDNVQRALSTYSQSVIPNPVPLDVDSSYDNNGDLALSFDDSSPVFKDLVASDSDIVDECIQPSLQACVVQTHTYVLLSNLLFDLNDGTLKEVTSGTLEEISGISTYKMFAGIPDRDIDMEVVDSIQNDVVKLETQVFDERFHTVRCDSNNVVKFDEMLFTLPCMISDCSSFAYLSELDPSKLPLSLYRFSPAQFKLEFPFDPGSDQFPYDLGANVFIVTSGGCLQVHQLHPATFLFNLLLVINTFSTFWFKFWAITVSTDGVHVLRVFEAIKNNWSYLFAKLSNWEQLGGVEWHIWDHFDYFCMAYKCSITVKELHSCDDKVEISEFIMSANFLCRILDSPYFVCNILTKALYSVLPNDDFECYMTLQPVSYSLPGFVASITFANHPFDPKYLGTAASEQFINLLELLLALNLVSLDARNMTHCLDQLCSKQKVSLLADMAHINGLVASLVMCSPFKYSTFVTFAIQFMGAKVYTTIVYEKSLFALGGFGNE
ncbi:hypothetical protein R3W88_027171 [Solanum pinnatisectum]|uniref:Serine hydroxymethyltransferase-like domain-containing protein n=1 Tax=Solanum pinnatisectum TaxID=50273 RepID=A0AAV9LJ26_9SOLN|nr:hypothetical protein R3W88_027171 [Solanum pinnatisectum]